MTTNGEPKTKRPKAPAAPPSKRKITAPEALLRVIETLAPLSPEQREDVMRAVRTFYGLRL